MDVRPDYSEYKSMGFISVNNKGVLSNIIDSAMLKILLFFKKAIKIELDGKRFYLDKKKFSRYSESKFKNGRLTEKEKAIFKANVKLLVKGEFGDKWDFIKSTNLYESGDVLKKDFMLHSIRSGNPINEADLAPYFDDLDVMKAALDKNPQLYALAGETVRNDRNTALIFLSCVEQGTASLADFFKHGGEALKIDNTIAIRVAALPSSDLLSFVTFFDKSQLDNPVVKGFFLMKHPVIPGGNSLFQYSIHDYNQALEQKGMV